MKLIKHYAWLLILFLGLLPLFSLFHPGMFKAHDSLSHLVRVDCFYQSIQEGNLFPRWAQKLNSGYGHPIFMFLYPLSSYLASLFHFFGLSFSFSIKLVLGLSFISAGLFMYLWLKQHFDSLPALLGALVFQLAPYRFVNLYVRNALGENTAYAFIPLSLLAFKKLIDQPKPRRLVGASLSLAGLILAHNAVSLMFLPFLILYIIFLLLQQQKKQSATATSYAFLAGLLAFGLSAFFWLPAFWEGKYTLREIVMRGDTFAWHFVKPKQLFIPHWGYGDSIPGSGDDLSLQIGLVQWAAFLAATFLLAKNLIKKKLVKKRNKHLLPFLAWLYFILGTFLLLSASLFIYQLFPIIKKFQFPWRFLTLPVFSSGILAAFAAQKLKLKPITAGIIIAIAIALTYSCWQPVAWLSGSDQRIINNYFQQKITTTDTGESTPRWAIRFQESLAKAPLEVVHGAPIDYQIHQRLSEIHQYTITATVPTQVADNTLYFPGWKAYVDGREVPITFQDQNWRGIITYPVPAGTHQVKLVFEETKLRQLANVVSLTSLLVIALLLLHPRLKLKFA